MSRKERRLTDRLNAAAHIQRNGSNDSSPTLSFSSPDTPQVHRHVVVLENSNTKKRSAELDDAIDEREKKIKMLEIRINLKRQSYLFFKAEGDKDKTKAYYEMIVKDEEDMLCLL